ncbi:MAG: 50S ribosome-binding GTPase, partial [Thermoguttaceae bacterium]|nr:50S ribosome-binding GTPase [Thermoguttaceae bacterium]
MSSKIIRAVLAGQPNSGKSTVFNNLTGAHEHVGNYPGITVEWHTGCRKYNGSAFELTDLPGTYSLSAYSDEERVARDYIINGDYDFVIDIVDAS